MSTASISLMFSVETSGVYVGTSESYQIRSPLDAHGSLLDLKRLPDEEGSSYWKRLSSVIPLRACSTQEGLVHGITRELGYEEKTALIITPTYANSQTIAPSPYIEVTATKIILYSYYVSSDDDTNIIDREIDIVNHDGSYFLSDVVSEIQESNYFVAVLGDHVVGTEKSCGLMPTSSKGIVEREWIKTGSYLRLDNTDIIPGTLSFTETSIFDTEVSPAVATMSSTGVSFAFSVTTPVTARGQYYVDYQRGIVIPYTIPSGAGTCRYYYRNFPLRIRWSPISVYSLRDSNYRATVFEDETTPSDAVVDGLVTAEGKEVYDQIFDKARCLWGV